MLRLHSESLIDPRAPFIAVFWFLLFKSRPVSSCLLSPPLIQTRPPALFFLLGPSQHWRLLRGQTSFSGGMPVDLDLSNCFLVSARFLPTVLHKSLLV